MCRCHLTVVTLTVTAPLPAAVTAVIWVAELTTKLAAAVPPKLTAVAPVKPVPVMTTLVPPEVGPDVGARPVTVGAGTKVKCRPMVPVPPVVVTLTVTAPLPAGGHRGDLGGGVDDEASRRGAAELDGGRAGEAGAGDDDARCRRTPGLMSGEAGDRRRGNEGEGAGRCAGAADGGDADGH